MSEQLKYCLGCMKSIPFEAVTCPHCGYNEETVQPAPYLDTGSLIMEKYLNGKVISTAPDSVTYIGARSFQGCAALSNIVVPANVVTIGQYAFESAGLTSVVMKEGVTTIGGAAFKNCTSTTCDDSGFTC